MAVKAEGIYSDDVLSRKGLGSVRFGFGSGFDFGMLFPWVFFGMESGYGHCFLLQIETSRGNCGKEPTNPLNIDITAK